MYNIVSNNIIDEKLFHENKGKDLDKKARYNIRYENENYTHLKGIDEVDKTKQNLLNRYSYQNNMVYSSNRGFNIVNGEENNLDPVRFDKGWDNLLKKSYDTSNRKVYKDPFDFTDHKQMKKDFLNTERNGIFRYIILRNVEVGP
jgi:hypothetical protein